MRRTKRFVTCANTLPCFVTSINTPYTAVVYRSRLNSVSANRLESNGTLSLKPHLYRPQWPTPSASMVGERNRSGAKFRTHEALEARREFQPKWVHYRDHPSA